MSDQITTELGKAADAISRIDPAQIRRAADVLVKAFRSGNQVIFCGNGGSAADAQHIAAEFSGRYMMERPALPGVCLSNIAPVTAIGNDYSYDIVFKRQVEGICKPGDVLVGLSTSGNSRNVILAMEEAKARGGVTVTFTGDCGRMREIADCAVVVPTTETPHVQEGYLCACHIVAGIVEREMFGSRAVFIDRDDTIARDVPYCDDPDKFEIFPDVPEAVARLNAAGYLVIVITNQSGIDRGLFSEETLGAIHDKLRRQVAAGGGRIDDIFYCPHTPDEHCSCRKPEIGLGLAAIAKHGIDPSRSWMVGDHDKDVEFGRRLGCRTVKVDEETRFSDAVDIILRSERRRTPFALFSQRICTPIRVQAPWRARTCPRTR